MNEILGRNQAVRAMLAKAAKEQQTTRIFSPTSFVGRIFQIIEELEKKGK